jgi:transcriptional regulator with XRE-family HTH domain
MKLKADTIGGRIREARDRAELTQCQLADAAGVEQSQVSRWERGESPKIESVRKLADVLGVRPGELIG